MRVKSRPWRCAYSAEPAAGVLRSGRTPTDLATARLMSSEFLPVAVPVPVGTRRVPTRAEVARVMAADALVRLPLRALLYSPSLALTLAGLPLTVPLGMLLGVVAAMRSPPDLDVDGEIEAFSSTMAGVVLAPVEVQRDLLRQWLESAAERAGNGE